MSELARRRRALWTGPTVMSYCDSCDRVLYVPADSLFCPVCSSWVMPTEDVTEVAVEAPSAF